ncbi:MAG TPA: hypothetical protein VK101_07935, partial [Limnochordia bacterium]|nr:hypothetical protein [Limnochordia bacterium]
MSKHWRTAALLLVVGVALAALWGAEQMRSRQAIERELTARYQQAFFDAVGHVENVEVLLSKGIAASTPGQLAEIFSDLRQQAFAAQANLTLLPLVQGTLIETSKFLTQVGDFGFTLAKKAAKGTPPSDDEMSLIRRMREEAARISAALHEIQREAAKGSMPWGELQSRTRRRLRQEEQPDAGFTRLEDHF